MNTSEKHKDAVPARDKSNQEKKEVGRKLFSIGCEIVKTEEEIFEILHSTAKKVAVVIMSLTIACSTANAETIKGLASWFSLETCGFNPDPQCPTASGKSMFDLEDKGVRFAAMWDVPFGTIFKVTNVENGKTTKVVILDRGPNKRLGRLIDLSKRAFLDIADLAEGVVEVEIEIVGEVPV